MANDSSPLIRQWTCLDQIRLSEILTRHCSVVGETQVEASLESPPTRTTCSSQGQANLSLSSPRDVCLPCQARDDCIQDAKRKLVSPIYPFPIPTASKAESLLVTLRLWGQPQPGFPELH
jgi:hypothetical protein